MKWEDLPGELKISLTYLSKFSQKPPIDTFRIIRYYSPNVELEEKINEAAYILNVRERMENFPKFPFSWVIFYVRKGSTMPLMYHLYKIVEFFQRFLHLRAPLDARKKFSIDLYPHAARFNYCKLSEWYYFTNDKRCPKGISRRVSVEKLLMEFCLLLEFLGGGESLTYFKEKFPQKPLYQKALEAESYIVKGSTSL